MTNRIDVLIVGTGHAGAQAAITLRKLNFDGSIAMIGDEPEYPYERPPLSKDYLAGEKSFERLLIRPEKFWDEREIQMLMGRSVVSVAPDHHRITLDNGDSIGYGNLVWATGGRPRQLDCLGFELPGVFSVRSRADADELINGLNEAHKVAIIGGGYIGLEAASVLRKLGKEVVLLEAQDRVLARVTGIEISSYFESEHRKHRVDLRTDVAIERLERNNSGERVGVIRLANGDRIETDMAIVGIGIIPAVEPLIAAGAEGTNGVDVNAYCQTNLKDIYAIGDCAAHKNKYAAGENIRLESVQNANDQALVAARAIMGQLDPYGATPWFWSNQYNIKLQTVGISAGYDKTVVRGDPRSDSFSIVYLKNGEVIAIDCINSTKDFVQGKKLVETNAQAPEGLIANRDILLKELVA